MESSLPSESGYLQVPVAVIGLACRLPGDCNSPTALWDFLERGGVAHNEAPETRFSLKTHHHDYKKPKTMRSPGGMFLENIDPQDFDAQFFGISGTDATAMDPQQRQLLEVVYECLENAGLSLEALDGQPVGCFVGSFAVDYADMQARDPEDRPPTITVGAGRAILSNRISHFLNIKGPSMTIDTACSGSLVSVDLACRYLTTREITGAIIAASNIYLSPEHVMDEGSMRGVASTSGRCHTFDEKADGYIKAEAVNAVILKRLDDAIRDGDPIRAIIRGSATNSDGRTPGIASPSSEAQATAIRAAYANAGISDINATAYVECHGTGTQAGDPIEVTGVSSVFSEARSAERPLIIGSIKSNIGHSEPAAGLSGLFKAILSIEKGLIPRNPTFQKPNPKIDFQTMKLRVPRSTISWPAGTSFRRASVNSFGYGGSNAHVIIDNDVRSCVAKAPRAHASSLSSDWSVLFAEEETSQKSLLVFSANDAKSLREYCKALCEHLSNPRVTVKLRDLAYTLSERRSRHFHRAFVVTDNTNINEGAFTFGKRNTDAPRIGFVFTGQGAQWSQMGKGIIETFPVAKLMISKLDDVLQALPKPPSWLLLNELTQPRESPLLRLPEFSQPLVTALQLAILAVLESWGVSAASVVGHSSGEIAAACAAGLLTPGEAIKVAYFRGQACTLSQDQPILGMLAVGLGPDQVQEYLIHSGELVQVACLNSPSSVTLSGDRSELEKVKNQIMQDGHFARMLQVDFAYHSKYMAGPAACYLEMLQQNCVPSIPESQTMRMFSSVTGKLLDRDCSAEYWKTNMVSPVRFDEAVRAMVADRDGADFLIEIGPSDTLSGPIGQIKKALGDQASNIQYCACSARGKDTVKILFDVAGKLFVAGGAIALAKVNQAQDALDNITASPPPSVIVDLPNYVWNHSTKYWHESEASKDWRFRKFPHHDLLGTKIIGTSWNAPSWRKTLKVENLHWLKDHRMGQDIVFPAAGFIAMAVEALSQALQATDTIEDVIDDQYRYRLRNATFPKALVLQEKGAGSKVMLALSQGQDSWYEFVVSSLMGETWNEHSRGLIRLEKATRQVAPDTALVPLTHTTPGQMWYKAMNQAGYNFGPVFQKHIEVETRSGVRKARSRVSLSEPVEEYQQSYYPLHPVCIDGCLQTVSLALFRGNRSDVDAVLIPAIIDSIVIIPTTTRPELGIAVTSSKYVGLGRPEASKNYMSEVSVYDPDTKGLVFEVQGIHYHQLDVLDHQQTTDSYCEMKWLPDITHLTQDQFLNLPSKALLNSGSSSRNVHQLIDMIAHKKPNLKVMEINIGPDNQTSTWLDDAGENFDKRARAACREYHFAASDATILMNMQEKYETHGSINFSLFDVAKPSPGTAAFDLILIKTNSMPKAFLSNILQNIRGQLSEGGYILLVGNNPSNNGLRVHHHEEESYASASDSEDGVIVNGNTCVDQPAVEGEPATIDDIFEPAKVEQSVLNLPTADETTAEQLPAVGGSEMTDTANVVKADVELTNDIVQDTSIEINVGFMNQEPPVEEQHPTELAIVEPSSVETPAAVKDQIFEVPTAASDAKEPVYETQPLAEAPVLEATDTVVGSTNKESTGFNQHAAVQEPASDSSTGSPYLSSQSEDGVLVSETDLEDSTGDFTLDANFFHSRIEMQSKDRSICLVEDKSKAASTCAIQLQLVHFASATETTSAVKEALVQLGCKIEDHVAPFANLPPKSTVLVLDELSSPVLTTIDDNQWQAIKQLTSQNHKILWVTSGSQFEVSKPDNALIHGLARTMRAEDPFLTLVTLDVESSTGINTVRTISRVLNDLEKSTQGSPVESEFVERGGVIYISRVTPDNKITPAEKKDDSEFPVKDLHESPTCVRLRCERLGTLDTLRWAEVAEKEIPLRDDMVEVEIVAAGLNFKDLAVTMGIVPENEHLLGLEGAGFIRRVGHSVKSVVVGQRVLLHNKGTFANRVQLPALKVHPLPDSMSFEDAATMPSVYLVTIYSLLHLAHMQKNQRVLIHSASGGVGIAAIQLCKYIGAQIYATVGSDEKRKFLMETFAIPTEHIFSSRSTDFASQIMSITDGEGVDIILNSITGELLDESWRCIADGGTMLEIGKKDMLARNNLSMEPFNRNASYHGVDMSHKQISNEMISRLLAELMDLASKGHIKPISPMTIFPFEDIVSAFRYMRGGNHVGKVVISNGTTDNIKIPVRPATPEVVLRTDGSYLIVGGLKGLCGSLAIYLARLGAKHLVIMCRSGYADEKSQAVLANVFAEGCQVDQFEGDVSSFEDVQRVFKEASLPIRGVIQGAMVLRDKIYTSMTVTEFHESITCKVKGTWNIHNASLEQKEPLEFFTMLSSISGVIGQKGQANYAAANVFLDSFATYRRGLGLPASSIDLGVIEDVGYVSERSELQASFDTEVLSPINERRLHKILHYSLLQPQDDATSAQLITGLVIPQPETSALVKNIRFGGLCFGDSSSGNHAAGSNGGAAGGSKDIRAFLMQVNARAEHATLLVAAVDIVSRQFTNSLRLSEPMEPGKPLTSYGLDSLTAVEFRNWVRIELGAELTTLDIMGAPSLFALCEKMIMKIIPVASST